MYQFKKNLYLVSIQGQKTNSTSFCIKIKKGHKLKQEVPKMKEKKNEKYEIGEDATRYGEFITSYFAWLPLSVQKEKVKDLESITDNKNKRKNAKQRENIKKIRKKQFKVQKRI